MANILEFLWYKNTAYQIPLQSYPLYQNYLGWIINWLINSMDRRLPWTIQSIGIVFRICKTLLFIIIWHSDRFINDSRIYFSTIRLLVSREAISGSLLHMSATTASGWSTTGGNCHQLCPCYQVLQEKLRYMRKFWYMQEPAEGDFCCHHQPDLNQHRAGEEEHAGHQHRLHVHQGRHCLSWKGFARTR